MKNNQNNTIIYSYFDSFSISLINSDLFISSCILQPILCRILMEMRPSTNPKKRSLIFSRLSLFLFSPFFSLFLSLIVNFIFYASPFWPSSPGNDSLTSYINSALGPRCDPQWETSIFTQWFCNSTSLKLHKWYSRRCFM